MKKHLSLLIAVLLTSSSVFAAEPEVRKEAPTSSPDKDLMAPPMPPEHGHRKYKMHRQPPPDDRFFENFPENERETLKKMAKEDPKAFHAEMRKRMREAHEKAIQNLMVLRNACLTEQDENKRLKNKQLLKDDVTEKFDMQIKMAENRIKDNEENLRRMTEQLEKLKAEVERRKANRDKIIDEMMNDILSPDFPKKVHDKKSGPPPDKPKK